MTERARHYCRGLTFRKPLFSSMATISVYALWNPLTTQPMNVERDREVPPPIPAANHPSRGLSSSVSPPFAFIGLRIAMSSAMPSGSCSSYPFRRTTLFLDTKARRTASYHTSDRRLRREGGLGASGPD